MDQCDVPVGTATSASGAYRRFPAGINGVPALEKEASIVTTQKTDSLDAALLIGDRFAMQDTLARYAWGYDEGDFDMLTGTFTENGTTSGKVANSEASWGPTTGSRAIADVLEAIRQQQTDLITSTQNGVTKTLTSGWYHASMVKEDDGEWRMADLTALLDSPF
jgi:hypothetical protein